MIYTNYLHTKSLYGNKRNKMPLLTNLLTNCFQFIPVQSITEVAITNALEMEMKLNVRARQTSFWELMECLALKVSQSRFS